MTEHARGSDGRRLFTPEFKRRQVERLAQGESTASELSREIGVSRTLLLRWKNLHLSGSEAAMKSGEAVVPASSLKAAELRIRELERALGRKTMEVEILQAARDEVKKKPGWYGRSSR